MRDLFKSNAPALIAGGIVFVVLSLPQFALVALLIFPLIWIFWLPYCVYVLLKKPFKRTTQLFRLTVWVCVALLIFCAHWGWYSLARFRANTVVSHIQAFRASQHHYPESLSEIGNDEERKSWPCGYGLDKDGKPWLLCPDTFRPFSVHAYDFDQQQWTFLSD